MADANDILQFNGINGASGEYGLAVTPEELVSLVRGESDAEHLNELRLKQAEPFPLRPDLDPGDLSQAGWGIIFPEQADQAIQEALSPLLTLRREQAGDYFRLFAGDDGYRKGDSKNDFLSRHGVGPGLVDPDNGVPYYLLLVGSPEEIPYDFQYQLDVQFAVGRIHFDTLDEYANYATSVVTAETNGVKLPRRVSFFGVANEDDRATQLSDKYLVGPLIEKIEKQNKKLAKRGGGWQIDSFIAEDATKAQLISLLNSGQPPALLFTASHGMEFPKGDSRQLSYQGALLCQDWPGPVEHRGPIDRDWYFAGEDISSDANLLGLISFNFACYGAGTPLHNEFAKNKEASEQIAPRPFLANLPLKMLGLPKGGALATVGHVERAWGHSIVWPGVGGSTTSFEVAMRQLLRQFPIGFAIEAFDLRYAELATELTMLIDRREKDGFKLAGTWAAHNDARSYVVLGDPAVRLPVAQKDDAPLARPVIKVKPVGARKRVKAQGRRKESAITTEDAEVDLGVKEFLGKTQANVSEAVTQFVDRLGTFLKDALQEAARLEVSTYTSDNMTGITYKEGKFAGPAELRAQTVIEIDGDIAVCVPLEDGEVDSDLWAIHLELVKQAQESRNELIKTAVSAATSFATFWKPG